MQFYPALATLRFIGRSKAWARDGTVLVKIGCWVVAAVVVAVGVMLWNLRQEALGAAGIETKNLAAVIAGQTSRSVQAVDIVLRDLQDWFTDLNRNRPGEFLSDAGMRHVSDFLRGRAARIPQVDVIALIGADGERVNYSLAWPPQPGNLADREFVRHFAAGRDTELFIGEPIISRATGLWSISLARGIYGQDGQYVGAIVAVLPLTAFTDFYASIDLPNTASILLLRRDGIVLVRHPDVIRRAGQRMPRESEWYRLVAQDGGNYTSPGYFDGRILLVAVHPLTDYPLVVDVALGKDTALSRWRRNALVIAIGTCCAAGCLLLMLWMLQRQFARLRDSENALTARNRDLTRSGDALRMSEARLAAASHELATTLTAMDQGLMMVDGQGIVAVCNARAMAMLNLSPELMACRPFFATIAANSSVIEAVNEVAAPNRDVQPDVFFRSWPRDHHMPDGGILEIRRVALDAGGFVATFDDVTARRRAEAQVTFLARHDPLTRLPNRAAFVERLEQAVAQAGRGSTAAVLCLDLDHFKGVNDTLGHPVGDRLLRVAAERLSACVREVDMVARFGGDEFAVVQHAPKRSEDVALLAQRIVDTLGQPYDLDEHRLVIGASLGIALVPTDGSEPDTLLKNADIALYQAKTAGRGTYRFFAPDMDAHLKQRRQLELDLHNAVLHHEFELLYQPVVDLSTFRVCAFEALLRWNHPKRGLLGPGEFIGLTEEMGLIVPIGQWALREACRAAAAWPNDVRVAVNLSSVQFRGEDLVRTVSEALRLTSLAGGRLELEITESVLLNNSERVLSILHELRALGVHISIDDFGTGYSSLSYLRSFPFDKIKIDQSFIRDLTGNKDVAAIVRAITRMSNSLGMSTTAEGVETSDQLFQVCAEGCTEVQGYLFSVPRPASDVPLMLHRIDHDMQFSHFADTGNERERSGVFRLRAMAASQVVAL